MFEFIKRRLKSEKGAMDKILVTLLLVVVGAAGVIGLATWLTTESANVQSAAETQIGLAGGWLYPLVVSA